MEPIQWMGIIWKEGKKSGEGERADNGWKQPVRGIEMKLKEKITSTRDEGEKGLGKLVMNVFWSKTSVWLLPWQHRAAKDMCWWMTVWASSIRQILRLEEQKERERVEASYSSAPLLVLTMTWCLSYCASQHTHTQFLSLKLPWCPREGEVNTEAGCQGWNYTSVTFKCI